MKNNIYIQEIEKLNNKLSLYNLIHKYFKLHWWFIISSPLFFLILGGVFYYFKYYFFSISSIILFFIQLRYIIQFTTKKTKYIIEKRYAYVLQEKENIYDKIIPEIQKQELIKLINNEKIIEKDNLLFLINSLKSKQNGNKYLYTISSNAIILFISLLFVLLSHYLDLFIQSQEFKKIATVIIGISLIIVITVIYLDITLRDWNSNKQKKKELIITTLENIYLGISNRQNKVNSKKYFVTHPPRTSIRRKFSPTV